MSLDSKEVGLTDFPRSDRPPVAHSVLHVPDHGRLRPAHAARSPGSAPSVAQGAPRLQRRALLWTIFLCFPLPFIATLTGWFTAEVGRQPWTVYGLLRTADALTPFLTPRAAAGSLLVFCAIYVFIFAFGTYYIYRLLNAGPAGTCCTRRHAALPNRPLSVVDGSADRRVDIDPLPETAQMILFWSRVLAISMLLYVLLDGFDLGVGMLFGLTRGRNAPARTCWPRCRRCGTATRPG